MNNPNDALYPEETWLQYASPGDAGYSPERLANAQDYFEQIGSSALLVIHDGTILLAAGQVNRRFECRSIRKSFLSALYGVHVGKGTIDLNRTLADLDIDDEPPLTEGGKEARVEDLLKSRSGVYHLAAFEAQDEKPARGSAEPDEHWYYNNWDFKWKDRQIIPRSWVAKSTTSYSSQGEDGYGYMWWVYDAHMPGGFRRFYELGMYEASGAGGQRITILPRANLVIVHIVSSK